MFSNRLLFYCLSVLSIAIHVACSPPEYFNIGLMFPIATDDYEVSVGVKYMAAMEMAIDEINDKNDGIFDDLLPHTELRMVVRSPLSAFAMGAEAAHEMVSIDDGKGVIGCVGPAGLNPMKGSNPVFNEAGNVPQIGYSSRWAILGDSRAYPNHLRTIPALYSDGAVVADLLLDFFEWDKVTLFATTDDYGSMSSFLFKDEAEKRGVEILSSHSFLVDTVDLSNEIKDAKKAGARIFVFLMHASDGHNLMKQGYEQGLFNKNTQIIGGGHLSTPGDYEEIGLTDQKVSELMHGYVGVRWKQEKVYPSPQLSSFIQRWKNRSNTDGSSGACDTRMDYYNDFYLHQFQPHQNESAAYTCAGVDFSSYGDDGSDLVDAMLAYDGVMSLVLALHQIAYDEGVCDPPPSHVLDVLHNDIYFEGLTGNVSYSTEYEHQHFDLGGRQTSYTYEVVNYVPGGDSDGNLLFKTASEWHSENGFEECDGHTVYSRKCHDFEFSTKSGKKTHDSPSAEIIEMPSYFSVVLLLLAASALALVVTVLVTALVFRQRRICRMAQPMMISLICVGLLMMCARVILAAIELSAASCTAEFWTGHLGFIIVIAALGVKTWRVYMVTSAMKKVKIAETKCVAIVGVIILVSSIAMLAHSIIGNIHVAKVTLVQDQFEYTKELKCVADNKDALYAVHAVEVMLVLFAGRMLWFTRKVASTISSTAVSATAVANVSIAIGAMYIILELVEFEPHVRQFLVALVIVLLTIRVTWILYSQLVIDVLLGYDLDKALQKKKMAWSITNIGIFSHAAKVIGGEPSAALSSSGGKDSDGESYEKAMAKFSKSKNAGELQFEIDKIKKEIADRQSELACLENMKFASNHSGNSSSSKNGSFHPAEENTAKKDNTTARQMDMVGVEVSSRRHSNGGEETLENA